MTWLLDLDGVVWLADQPIPGSVEAVRELRAGGTAVAFVTNNSSATVATYLEKLDRLGVPCAPSDLVTSAQAAASLLEPGEKVLVCAGPGVTEAADATGALVVDDPLDANTVVVGWHRQFDFDRLTAAAQAIWAGARLIGTNDDPTYPTPTGQLPGGGAILAAVACAGGVAPVVAGKPHRPMADLLQARFGDVEVFVGDRPSTDGRMALRLGVPFARVRSGVVESIDGVEVACDEADLAAVVRRLRG